MSTTAAFVWLVAATAMGFVLSALGAAVVLLLREPARRVRAIELTLLACLAAPWLPAVPGLPRVAWREWLAAAPEVAEKEAGGDVAALPEPAAAIGPSAVREPAERASSPPIIELAVVPEPSVAPSVDLTVDRAPLPAAELALVAPIEQAEVPLAVAATAAELVAPSPPPAVELPATRPVDWQAIVVSLYLVGVAAIILLDALGGLALLRVWKSSRDAEPRVQALLSEVAGQSVGRVSLLVSPRCRQPFTFAWLWPVIVLPPALVAPGKQRELRWALAHEWSHVANRHTWGWALAGLARAIYWPQPLIWLLRRRLRLEQDFLADAQAAGRAAEAPDYATFLTTQAATAHGLTLGLGIAGGKSELARRVVMLVQGKRPVATCGWGWSLALTAAMALLAIGAGSIAPGNAATAQDEPPVSSAANEQAAVEEPEHPVAPFDKLTIRLEHLPRVKAAQQENASDTLTFTAVVDAEGSVLLGARYGRVPVGGLTIEEASRRITERVRSASDEDVVAGLANWSSKTGPTAQVEPVGSVRSLGIVDPSDWAKPADNFIAPPPASAPIIPGNLLHVEVLSKSLERLVFFEYPVLDDGTIGRFAKKGSLRIQGAVQVAGLTLAQAEEAISKHVEVTNPAKVEYVAVQFAGWSDHLPNRGEQKGRLVQSLGASGPHNGQASGEVAQVPDVVNAGQDETSNAEEPIAPFDLLTIEAVGVPAFAEPSKLTSGERPFWGFVDREGEVLLGARFGRAPVAGLSVTEAEAKILERLKAVRREDTEAGRLTDSGLPVVVQVKRSPAGRARSLRLVKSPSKRERPIQAGDAVLVTTVGIAFYPPNGQFVVEPKGTLALGPRLGRVEVQGLTPEAAGERILERIREALPKFQIGYQVLRPDATVRVTFAEAEQSLPKTKFAPLPTPGQRIAAGTSVIVEALGPNLEPRLLGQANVDSDGKLSLRRTAERNWLVGIDADLKAAGLTEKELEAAIRSKLEMVGPVAWLAVRLGGYDSREPGWVESTADQPSNGGTSASPRATRPGGSNLRFAGKSFDQWREVLQNDLDPNTRMTAISALAKFGANGMAAEAAEAIVPFIGFRDRDEQVVYATALETLRNMGEPALPAVVSALASPDERIRKSAAYLLSEMPADPAGLAALVKALDDQAPAVRVAAAGALGAHRQEVERAGQALEEVAKLDDEALRAEVAQTLMGHFPPTEARLRIASDYLDRDDQRNMQAQFGRDARANPEFMVPLMAMRLERAIVELPPDRDDAGRRRWSNAPALMNRHLHRQLQALMYAGPKAAPALPTVLKLAERPDIWQAVDSQILTVLRVIGPEAAPTARPVLERLRSLPNGNRRGEIEELLRSWGEAPAEAPAEPQGEAPSKTTDLPADVPRQYAGKSFAAWRAVLEKDLDPATRIEAITAIGEFGASGMKEEAVAALATCLGNQSSAIDGDKVRATVGQRAAAALATLGAAALPAAIKALGDENVEVRRDAYHVVAKLGNEAAPAAEALVAAVKREGKAPAAEWLAGAQAVAGITSRPDVTLPVLQMLVSQPDLVGQPDWEVRQAGLSGLAKLEIPDEEAVRLIVEALGGPPKNRAGLTAATIGAPPQRRVKILEHMLRTDQGSPDDRLGMLHAVLDCAADLGRDAAPLVPLLTEAVEGSAALPGDRVAARQRYIAVLTRMGAGAKSALPYLRSLPNDPSHHAAKHAIQRIEQSK